MGLFAMYMNVRMRSAFGLQVDQDELKDFELDVVTGDADQLGQMDDSKTFEQLEEEEAALKQQSGLGMMA